MNVDQSTRAIRIIIHVKSVIWIFWTKPMKYPSALILCALFHQDRGWENESSWGQIGRYIYFVNLRSKVITSRKYI